MNRKMVSLAALGRRLSDDVGLGLAVGISEGMATLEG